MVLTYGMAHWCNIYYGVDTLTTAQTIWLADSYGLNIMIMDGTTLYSVINTLHDGGNPTTFAYMQLILASLSAEAVKP